MGEPTPPKRPYIEVVHYRGKNGGYAREHIDLWIARIIGHNGTRQRCDQSSWHGVCEYPLAMAEALRWAELLGCEIVEVEGGERPNGMPP